MGINSPTFLEEIREITLKHFPDTKPEQFTHKLSQGNKYLAITATVYATSQEQLDAYYQEITKHPEMKMVL